MYGLCKESHLQKCSQLTVILSSRSLTRTLFLFQEMVGSGWPLGGIHSMTAGSPAATTTSLGVWRKSSLRTAKTKDISTSMARPFIALRVWFWLLILYLIIHARRSLDFCTDLVISKVISFTKERSRISPMWHYWKQGRTWLLILCGCISCGVAKVFIDWVSCLLCQ